jgi:hypothetical protein
VEFRIMKVVRTVSVIALAFLSSAALAKGQAFEGEIVYQYTYKSNIAGVTDDQLAISLGSKQNYFIRGGDYKSVSNATSFSWQIYIGSTNKLYYKMANSDVILWVDGASRSDQIVDTKVNREATEILGYKCDEAIFTLKNGSEKYYFSSKLGVDPSLYSKHLYGNWYDYLKIAKAVPLKMIVETPDFVMTSTAIEITPMKLAVTEFQLPKGAKTAPMPN